MADSVSIEELMPKLVETTSEGIGWSVGVVWWHDEPGAELRCIGAWHAPAGAAPARSS